MNLLLIFCVLLLSGFVCGAPLFKVSRQGSTGLRDESTEKMDSDCICLSPQEYESYRSLKNGEFHAFLCFVFSVIVIIILGLKWTQIKPVEIKKSS